MNSTFGYKLEYISLSFFMAFVAVVGTGVIPASILNPSWQLKFSSVLVQNAPLALVGVLIVLLGARIDRENVVLRNRRDLISRWSIYAAIGFFLLLPLQGNAAMSVYTASMSAPNRDELSVLNRRYDGIARAINESSNISELQARLAAVDGPLLSSADMALPLSILRPRLLATLDRAKLNAIEQVRLAKPSVGKTLVLKSLHVMISALGYGLAFAATAQKPGSDQTLLQRWQRDRSIKKMQKTS